MPKARATSPGRAASSAPPTPTMFKAMAGLSQNWLPPAAWTANPTGVPVKQRTG
ncbi:hypothetical protein [Streptomyces ipomoeae]|uniref:hypothetical protein n=1 Tax=Streptomyces ipomoeae TaxID=103232 RepID=UPI0015F0EFE8|nr:hypothetical protein [Streptomyces ipomoeae]MDX2937537.1 hypothetical protein [Streptomyces ipomoeae]